MIDQMQYFETLSKINFHCSVVKSFFLCDFYLLANLYKDSERAHGTVKVTVMREAENSN